jgi:undecaprenyl diphosphate synthase
MHVGIIMDGNGRWATAQGLPRLLGHKAGIDAVKAVIKDCSSLNVDTVTLFAFAIANWKRDKEEVDGLWKLFHQFFSEDVEELLREGVRVVCIGNRTGLPPDVLEEVVKVEEDSKNNSKSLLQIALNYDGVDEVVRMMQKVITDGVSASEITPAYIDTHLDTEPNNVPDIIVRTGMDASRDGMSLWRSSAFLPLQSVQSVCVSSEVLWPDFTVEHLKKIIDFAKPELRLFGGQRK